MLIAIILTFTCIIAAITFDYIVIATNKDHGDHVAMG